MNWSVRKLISAFVVLWLVLPPFIPYSEVGYSWPRKTVKKCIETTTVILVTYPKTTVLGGGVIISKTGRVLTAAHLFTHGKYETIMMVTWDGKEYETRVLSVNSRIDLALIEPIASAQDFQFARLQKANELYVGEDLLIVGHPYDQFWTVSAGIISRLPWILWYFSHVVETDALVSPGNSGGPAFSRNGEIIGIVSAKYLLSGIGVIIPIKDIHFFLRAYEMKNIPSTQIKRYKIGDIK